MAKKKTAAITHDPHEAIHTVDAGAQFAPKTVAEDPGGEDPKRLVKIILPVQLKINRVSYGPGPCVVQAHMIDSMVEMVDKKKRADISVFTGNNFLVQRMIDRSLVVTKVDKI